MRRIERIRESLLRLSERVDRERILAGFNGFSTEEICAECGVDRANASRELNQLVLSGGAVKVQGRPVSYFDAQVLQRLFGLGKVPSGALENLSQVRPVAREEPKAAEGNMAEDFDAILACCPSLDNVVKQCKAAIIYPPNGLHTLLVGPSGVGKTMYAEAMYHFAHKAGLLGERANFVIFNCAEYADNPQLLLSQLFGYAKGAFTGADRGQTGVIDQADGGVLLLDEVHRLPPQGQEMLFTLMDKGYFRRLGKSGDTISVNLRLVCATSEDVESHILTTFLRRIPMVIHIPALRDYPLQERFNLIRRFFIREADALGYPVRVSWKAMLGLLLYEPKGNVGQLRSDIQLICARGYLEHTLEGKGEDCIKIGTGMVPDEIYQGVLKLDSRREEVERLRGTMEHQQAVTFHGQGALPALNDGPDTAKLYGQIQRLYEKYTSRNMGKDAIGANINQFIEDYISGLMDESSLVVSHEENEKLYKMVSRRVYDAAVEALGEAERMLDHRFTRKVAEAFALHVSVLLERLNTRYVSDVGRENLRELVEEHPAEYAAARRMWEIVQKRLSVVIPEEEIIFFSVFLYSLDDQDTQDEGCVGVVVLAHGRQTASSMAEVANTLLKTSHCKAVDMDLSEQVEHCLQRTCQLVREADEGKGVLLLVDMGSLTAFADLASKETGVPVRCVDMVSTPLVLEAVRKSLFRTESLESLAENLVKKLPYTAKRVSLELVARTRRRGRPLVVTTCISGLGAAERLAHILLERVPAVEELDVEVRAVDYQGRRLSREEAGRAVAVVGATDLKLPGVPYISTDEIVLGRGFQTLGDILRGAEDDRPLTTSEATGEVPSYLVDNMLREYLAFLDPVKASRAVERSFRRLSRDRTWRDPGRIRLCYQVHNCCLIERGIQGQYLSYDDVEARMARDPALTQSVRAALAVLEEAFGIEIPDTEAAYVLDMVDTD